jgi:hypothetical protein
MNVSRFRAEPSTEEEGRREPHGFLRGEKSKAEDA